MPQPAFYAEIWTRTDSDTSSFSSLATLLPPGPNVAHLLGHLLLDEAETPGTAADSAGSSDGAEQAQMNQQLPTAAVARQSFNEGSEMVCVDSCLADHLEILAFQNDAGLRVACLISTWNHNQNAF